MPEKNDLLRGLFFFMYSRTGLEPLAVQHAGGMLLPPVQTLVATIIFALGKNANRVRSPAPKIDKFRQKLVDFTFSLFTIHYSLFTILYSLPARFNE